MIANYGYKDGSGALGAAAALLLGAGQAGVRVRGQNFRQPVPAGILNRRRIGLHRHACFHRRFARFGQLIPAVHLNGAQSADTAGGQVGMGAEARNIHARI